MNNHMESLEQLTEMLSSYVFELQSNYKINPRDTAILLDTYKYFAAEYAHLLENGKVDVPFSFDYEKSINHIQDILKDYGEEI